MVRRSVYEVNVDALDEVRQPVPTFRHRRTGAALKLKASSVSYAPYFAGALVEIGWLGQTNSFRRPVWLTQLVEENKVLFEITKKDLVDPDKFVWLTYLFEATKVEFTKKRYG